MKKRSKCGLSWCERDHLFCEAQIGERLTLVGGRSPYLVASARDTVLLFDGPARLKRLRDALTKALRSVPKSRRPK